MEMVRSGAKLAQISNRYWKRIHAGVSEEYVTEKLRMLEGAGFSPY